jgi:hypothetical protein
MVTQVDKQNPAVVTDPVDPARQAHSLAHVGGVQIGASMAAKGVHRIIPQCCRGRADTPPLTKEVKARDRFEDTPRRYAPDDCPAAHLSAMFFSNYRDAVPAA